MHLFLANQTNFLLLLLKEVFNYFGCFYLLPSKFSFDPQNIIISLLA